ncbi:MAG: DUF58 domain-containing protein [Cytophagales bacterium]
MMKQEIKIEDILKFENLELLAKHVVEGFITGLHRSPYHGFSVEFAEHRQYNLGESTRHIDWKLYSKTDKLFVKNFDEETNLRCYLLVDCSSSMNYPEETLGKLSFSFLAAAAIAKLLQKQRDAVSLTLFSDDIEYQSSCKSTNLHFKQLIDTMNVFLNERKKEKRTQLASSLEKIALVAHKRSLIVIFSDMFENSENLDQIFKSLQHLRHQKHEIIIFHVFEKETEMELYFKEQMIEFIDTETGEKVKLSPSQVKKEYAENFLNYTKTIHQKCQQFKIDFVPADINSGFEKILFEFLSKRAGTIK